MEEGSVLKCAMPGCDNRVIAGLKYKEDYIAYACSLPHFQDVMYATRHLDGRLIEELPLT